MSVSLMLNSGLCCDCMSLIYVGLFVRCMLVIWINVNVLIFVYLVRFACCTSQIVRCQCSIYMSEYSFFRVC